MLRLRRRAMRRRPRRYARRKLRRTRRFAPSVHRIKESFTVPGGTSSLMTPSSQVVGASSGQAYKLLFQVNQITNWGSLKQTYDLYRITGAKITILPRQTVNTGAHDGNDPGYQLATLYIAPNRNPFVPAPASITDVLNDDYVKIRLLNKPMSFYIKSPKFPNLIRNDAGQQQGIDVTTLGVRNMFQEWLPTGGNQQSYGADDFAYGAFRMWVDNTNSVAGNNTEFEIIYTLYVELKEQD